VALLPEQTPILLFQLLYLFIAFFYCITNRFHITATPLRLCRFAGNTPYAARLYHVRERNKEECISLCLFGAWRLYTASRNSFLNQHSSFFILRGTRNPVRESSGHGTQAVGRGRCSGVPQINNNTIWTAIAIAVYATLSNRFCSVSYISTYI
jgi:hypothetical protein